MVNSDTLAMLAEWRRVSGRVGDLYRVSCDGRVITLSDEDGEILSIARLADSFEVAVVPREGDSSAAFHAFEILDAVGVPASSAAAISDAIAKGLWREWSIWAPEWLEPRLTDLCGKIPDRLVLRCGSAFEDDVVEGAIHRRIDGAIGPGFLPTAGGVVGFLARSGGRSLEDRVLAALSDEIPSVVMSTSNGALLIGRNEMFLLAGEDPEEIVDVHIDEVDPSGLAELALGSTLRGPAAALAFAALTDRYPEPGEWFSPVGGVEELGSAVVGFSLPVYRGLPAIVGKRASEYIGVAVRRDEESVLASGYIGPAAVESDAWVFFMDGVAVSVDLGEGIVSVAGIPLFPQASGSIPAYRHRELHVLAAMGAVGVGRIQPPSDGAAIQLSCKLPVERMLELAVTSSSGVVAARDGPPARTLHVMAAEHSGFAVGLIERLPRSREEVLLVLGDAWGVAAEVGISPEEVAIASLIGRDRGAVNGN